MKRRKGFVGNSSSSAFILDGKDKRVKKMKFQCQINPGFTWGRGTKVYTGEHAIDWIQELIDSEYTPCWAEDALKVLRKLGNDAILAMESDEGMGGFLFGDDWEDAGWRDLPEIAVFEFEYH